VTKVELVEQIREKADISKKEAEDLLEDVLEIMKFTLDRGEDLKISGFGKFEVRQKADRRGRNPQTGETITIEARKVLTYKPSPVLRQVLNPHDKVSR
jgi:integration host factor subunit alpha